MALQYTVRPISDRSPFTGKHTGSLFTVKWHQVLDLLHGVTKRGEQYTGWKALPSGSGLAPTGMTTERAVEILRAEAPESKQGEPLDRQLRWARAGAHPDRHNGDRSRWDAVEQAEQVLRRAGRLS